MKILLRTDIICDLISVQLQTCWIQNKQIIIFRILGKLKQIFKIIINFLQNLQFLK